MLKEFLLCSLCLFLILLFIDKTHAHPDGAKPFWYPSSFIYGYVEGCSQSVEEGMLPFTEEFWPDEVRSICGCVVDAMRHSLTYEEITDNASESKTLFIASATFPICIQEEAKRKQNK